MLAELFSRIPCSLSLISVFSEEAMKKKDNQTVRCEGSPLCARIKLNVSSQLDRIVVLSIFELRPDMMIAT